MRNPHPKSKGLLAWAIAIVFFSAGWMAFAQEGAPPPPPAEEVAKKADIAITNLWAINSTPAPNGVVDFTVFYGNLGTDEAVTNVELKIEYDSQNLYEISLGDTNACTDEKTAVVCRYNTLTPAEANTVGFTARVVPTATPETAIYFTASIKGDATENNVINDFSTLSVTVTALEKGGRLSATGIPAGLERKSLEQVATKGSVWLFDVQNNPNWKTDLLSTLGLKFMIRGKEALAWTLNIREAGFHNPAIQANYLKVLTVVNSLFILGLLAIAALWMFSLLVPRRVLRQVILVYALAVVFVNFALPLNQLLIDSTQLLQRTFIGSTNISDIVEMPTYNDPKTVGYENETGTLKQAASKTIQLNLGSAEQQEVNNLTIGKLQQGFQTPVLTGTLTAFDAEGKPRTQIIDLQATGNDALLQLNANQSLKITNEQVFNPNEEHRIFAFAMLLLTGLAYFGMALVFILRIVILWALMIVSPVLFLLAIFRSTRGTFMNWLAVYSRWLLIGPLMALGIAMVVGIWKTVGMPVASAYPGVGQFGQLTNIGFFLPGASAANNLSTTPQMMEYLLFLTMLYLPLVFAFMLTRQGAWPTAAFASAERPAHERMPTTLAGRAEATIRPPTMIERAKELTAGLKAGIARLGGGETLPALPANLRTAGARGTELLAGTRYAPEQLALASVRDIVALASGVPEGTRNLQGKAIERLAAASQIEDRRDRENLTSIRHEIEGRAAQGQPEAVRLVSEIREKEQTLAMPVGMPTVEVEVKTETLESEKAAKPLETKQTSAESISTLLEEEEDKTIQDQEQIEKKRSEKNKDA